MIAAEHIKTTIDRTTFTITFQRTFEAPRAAPSRVGSAATMAPAAATPGCSRSPRV